MNQASVHEDDYNGHIDEFHEFRRETKENFDKLFRNQNIIFGAWGVLTTVISIIEILQHYKP